ncbi:hypothetical protein QYF61_010289 [Mycteria americana]|uniref:Uncharacterized protein n=1 Tax=Mycteria americana TaxID=33587 RepID=A0AAN7N172_MYCAM|nr:hypothetical protein QYF61_010289 [Mycteria americana]
MAQAGVCLAGSSPVGKVLVGRELDRRQPCVLAAGEASRVLGCMTRSTARIPREGILWNNPPRIHIPNSGKYWQAGEGLAKGPQDSQGLEHFACKERLRELGLSSPEKGRTGWPHPSLPVPARRSWRIQSQGLHCGAWSWLLGEVPEEWKEANVTPVSKKGKKEDLGSCQPVSSSILLDRLTKYRLDKGKVRWTGN